jgi:hypothetical protein
MDAYIVLSSCESSRQLRAQIMAAPLNSETALLRQAFRDGAPDYQCMGVPPVPTHERLSLLERAVAGHVRGSAASLMVEGPFGDPSALETRPDDPLAVEWEARVKEALIAQAARGDETAMGSLAMTLEAEGDKE